MTSEAPAPFGARLRAAGSGVIDALDRERSFAQVALALGVDAKPPRVGPYPILERLGSGSMGTVYAALDRHLHRRIAIKLLHDEDPAHRERLQQEARLLAGLADRHVVTVYQVGEHRGRTWMAMALVDGVELGTWLRGRGRDELLDVFLGAGEGLAAAHAAGLVHRDFKPSNVLVDAVGVAKVVDFGVASPSSRRGELGGPGEIVGTPVYMAPEQHAGEGVGPAADQFAFCLSLAEAMLGRLPYAATTLPELIRAKRDGALEPGPAEQLPRRLWRVLARGLAPDPRSRHPDMRALLRAIQRSRRSPARRWLPAIGVGLGAAALGLFVATQEPRGEPEPRACVGYERELDQLWDPATQERIAAAFEQTGLAMAGDAYERIAARIDARLDAWRARQYRACRESRWGVLDARAFDMRQRCLAQRLDETKLTIALLEAPDRALVEAAPSLPLGEPVATCDLPWIAHWLQREHPTAADRPRALELERRTQAASAKIASGQVELARAELDEILSALEAEPLDAVATAPLRVRSQLEPDPARRDSLVLASLTTGLATFNVRETVASSIDAVHVARIGNQLELADEWLELGLAENRRYRAVFADDPGAEFWAAAFEAELENQRGLLVQALGRTDEALAAYRRSLARLDPVADAFPNRAVNGHNNVAEILRMLGDYPAALPEYDRAVELATEHLGPRHPLLAAVLGNRAGARIDMGEPALARPDLERAIAILEDADGPDAVGLVVPVINLGLVHHGERSLEQAARALRRGAELATRHLGEHHPFTAYAHGMIGAVLRDQGQLEQAQPLLDGAVAGMRAVFPNGHALTASMLVERAEARRLAGSLAEARADAEEALTMLAATGGGETPPAGVAGLILAKTLRDAGEPAAATQAAAQAVALLTELGPERRPELVEARALVEALAAEPTREAAER